ncbi:MAG: DUF1553 domain-containing protein [Bryobacteraceae bacterium]
MHSSRLAGLCLITKLVLAAAPGAVDFDREIRPILADNCFACHGPDEKQRMANLRLDIKEGMFAERSGKPVIAPGDSAASRLFQRISATDKAKRMPPSYSERSLAPAQVELIKKWIDQGAKWELHWSYVPPKRPDVPSAGDSKWPRNSIDNFILARLTREGLKPSPEASRATLLRRVTLDLTGLPPSPAELDAFLADKFPDAYEKVVDRLLHSPHYGERMAMQWLDLARYADTHGYHIDSHREMWHWRDWVIDAFNRNMPFDEFTIDQLAGDLLPNATLQQKIATGFNRNHMINFEGGAIPEEYQTEYVVDRVEATSNTWMGMTLGCARCHDHKYDPIKQRDFYRFFAFFNTIPEKGLDGRAGNAKPYVQIPSPEQAAQLAKVKETLENTEKTLADSEVDPLIADWEKPKLDNMPAPSREALLAHYSLDGNFADRSGHYHDGRTLTGAPTFDDGPVGKAAHFEGESEVSFGDVGDFDSATPFSLALWLEPNSTKEVAFFQRIDSPVERRGYELLCDESVVLPRLRRGLKLRFRLTNHWPDNAIEIRTKRTLIEGDFVHLGIAYDGSSKAAGLKMYVDGEPVEVEVLHDTLSGPIRNSAALEIGNKKLGPAFRGRLDDFRIYGRQLAPAEIAQLAAEEPVRVALFLSAGQRSKEQKKEVRDYFLKHDAPEPLKTAFAERAKAETLCEDLDWTVPSSMVMEEMDKPWDTFILGRGDYRNHGEKVTPAVPAMLPPLPADLPANRLGLAKWLVSPSNPLTARVAVNRYWQMYFGHGIVKTAEDFGSQGEAPVHPELLDWLATEFVRTGWDIRAMQRLIVTSAAYRQDSRVSPDLLEKDPENRLLARGPRFRLPAEVVRDNALAVSGLLDNRLGGPSVYPYQPKGLWEEMAFGDVYSAQTYVQSHGADLYRRSMYTFWKRTVPPASLSAFDAPDREKCTARRTLTNTPLQALVLLNDPTYIEAARLLAQRMLEQGGKDASSRINYGFRLVTARKPDANEVRVLKDIERQELAQYRRDGEAAHKLIQVGESPAAPKLDQSELAAWTTVASTILNLDEAITKE